MSEQMNEDFAKDHPLLAQMTIDEILIAAERWMAITTHPQYSFMAARGFVEAEQAAEPNRRSLTVTMSLTGEPLDQEHLGVQVAREEGVYKLTDLADLVRARVLEDRQS